MNILVTGGAGYIGSHTVRALQQAGYTPIIVDNLSRGHVESIPEGVTFYNMDIADPKLVDIMKDHNIIGVMHFAAHSQVGESMVNPAIYYENNVVGSYHLIESARTAGVKHFVFSSTAAVYGEPEVVPIREDAQLQPTNVYGRTKLMIEEMLSDYSSIYGSTYVALEHITVFGTDYDTADGTCVRDYIHVNDLAAAHVLAMDYLRKGGESQVFNLGSGNGFSVKEIIETAKEVTGIDIPVQYGERRAGDPGTLIASSEKIKNLLGWDPKFSNVADVIKDAWKWHTSHPDGFNSK